VDPAVQKGVHVESSGTYGRSNGAVIAGHSRRRDASQQFVHWANDLDQT
jgi:hypothetical protein